MFSLRCYFAMAFLFIRSSHCSFLFSSDRFRPYLIGLTDTFMVLQHYARRNGCTPNFPSQLNQKGVKHKRKEGHARKATRIWLMGISVVTLSEPYIIFYLFNAQFNLSFNHINLNHLLLNI